MLDTPIQYRPSPENLGDDLGDEIAKLAAQIDAATYRLLCLIRDYDNAQGWVEQGCLSCAHWLSWRLGWTPATARERLRVAHALEQLPAISARVEAGEVSYSKARAVTRVATTASDEEWASTALEATAAQLERIVRCYRREERSDEIAEAHNHHDHRGLHTFYDDDDGMLVIQGRLAPEAGALFMKALEAAAARERDTDSELTYAQRQADALVELSGASLVSDSDSLGDRYQVVVHVDAEVLADPSLPGRSEIEEGPEIPAETSRRIACDGSVVEMTHGTGGEILSVGRKTRAVSTPIRRALRERDGCCRFPSCTNRIVDIHHVEHWSAGGETKLENLLLACRRHHIMLHEGGYRIELDALGQPTFLRPDGVRIPDVAHAPKVGNGSEGGVALLRGNTSTGVQIDAMTAYPRWDGEAVDYEYVVAVMRQSGAM
jgi:hypothetical protein